MKEIKLKNGGITLVDDEDYELVSQFKWLNSLGYAIRTKGAIPMHRFLMNAKKGQMIDHKDRDKLNNQKGNLRFCTNSENQKNKKPRGTSKYLGVFFQKNKIKYITKKYGERTSVCYSWVAVITVNGKRIYLGRFKNEIEAAKIYDKEARKHHKEFANLNFK